MPRMKLILNPRSDLGNAEAKSAHWTKLVEEQALLASQGGEAYEVDWVTTEQQGHAVDLAYRAAQEGYDIVVAFGGDGTVHEVVNGLMRVEAGQRPCLGVVPVGSGNDFADNLGLPSAPEKAIHCLFSGRTRPVDAATIGDGRRTEYWNNTLGFGFSGAVNIATRSKARYRGFLLYFVSVLETILLNPQELNATIQFDDQQPFDRLVTMISICNGRAEGGGFPVAPHAVVDDGLLSYVILRRLSRLQMCYFLLVVMMAQHPKYRRFFQLGSARRIRITSDRPMAIHTDGEVFSQWDEDIRQVEVEVIPSALRVLCGP
jgi:diacylglycerol kinase (ATP)